MRMSVGMRILFTIFLIVIICALVVVLLAMFGVIGSSLLESVFATALHGGFWYKFAYAAVCVVMIVIAFILMFFGAHKRAPQLRRLQNSMADELSSPPKLSKSLSKEKLPILQKFGLLIPVLLPLATILIS